MDEPVDGHRVHLQVGRAPRQHLDEGVAFAVALDLQSSTHGFAGLADIGDVRYCHAGHIDRCAQVIDELAEVQGIASKARVAALLGGNRLLAHQRGGCHLSASHPVDRVVDEEHRQAFASIRRLQGFVEADGRQVAIALVGEYDGFVAGTADAGAHCRSTAVGYLDVAAVEVVVGEDGTADRTDHHRSFLDAQVDEGLRDQLVQHPMAAAGAVMGCGRSRSAFADELAVDPLRGDYGFVHGSSPQPAACRIASITWSSVSRLPP